MIIVNALGHTCYHAKVTALQVIKAFVIFVENQFNTHIQIIRSDNGLEFTNIEANQFFQSKGIIHQKSCPYTPQQNGVVEWKHKYMLETARALLFQSQLPIKYWGECLLTATYIINRLPTTHFKTKCPFELLQKRKPEYSHIKYLVAYVTPLLQKISITNLILKLLLMCLLDILLEPKDTRS